MTDNKLEAIVLAGGEKIGHVTTEEYGSKILSLGGANTLVFSKAAMTSPAELWAVPVAGGAASAITHENQSWLQTVSINAPESFAVPGAGGSPIQYWVIKPPSFDPSKKYPIVFLIHGGPQGEWGDAWSARWNPTLWAAQGWGALGSILERRVDSASAPEVTARAS